MIAAWIARYPAYTWEATLRVPLARFFAGLAVSVAQQQGQAAPAGMAAVAQARAHRAAQLARQAARAEGMG